MSFKADGPRTRPDRVKPPAHTESNQRPWAFRRSSASSTSSFHSAHSTHTTAQPTSDADLRFTPEEEQSMVSASNMLKSDANILFSRSDFVSAISTYDRALSELPSYLDYEIAVLQSNIAACHIRLEQWKEAISSCERGLEGLERIAPTKKPDKKPKSETDDQATTPTTTTTTTDASKHASEPEKPDDNDAVIELPSDADEAETTALLQTLQLSDERKADIHRIRTKLLLRLARSRSSTTPPSWSALSAALSDYQTLMSPEYFRALPPSDQKTVRLALATLPARVDEAKQKEVGEMMGKLKDVGNSFLGMFGLSTDNFKVQQGEGGGYSLAFDGTAGKQ